MVGTVVGDDEQVIGSADHLIDRAAWQRTEQGHASLESPSWAEGGGKPTLAALTGGERHEQMALEELLDGRAICRLAQIKTAQTPPNHNSSLTKGILMEIR